MQGGDGFGVARKVDSKRREQLELWAARLTEGPSTGTRVCTKRPKLAAAPLVQKPPKPPKVSNFQRPVCMCAASCVHACSVLCACVQRPVRMHAASCAHACSIQGERPVRMRAAPSCVYTCPWAQCSTEPMPEPALACGVLSASSMMWHGA